MAQENLPLKGIRVADFGWIGVGPLCTRLLAMHGAEVVRVESRKRMDRMRNRGPFPPGRSGPNTSGRFNGMNNDKLGITLDITTQKGLELARRLISISDVLAHNFAGGVMERLGLGYEDVVKIRPDIIYISMTVMGSEGPHRGYRAFGPHISALAGINYLTGSPRRPPAGFAMAYPDFTSNPYHSALAILAALHYRHRTGRGQFIDLAQYESTICLIGPAVLEYTINGRVPERQEYRVPYAAPHGVYPCKGEDRWCAIAVTSEGEWQGLRRAMGDPAWAGEARFATFPARKENEEALNALIAEWTSQHTAEEVVELLQREGVPAGVVQDMRDLLENDPQIRHRGFYTVLDHPEAGPITYSGMAFRYSDATWRASRPAPCLGQDNRYVYEELLGLTESEVESLVEEGVIG
jgi:benzylsuccinate CoA-transferase BbsF subunit